MKINQNIKIAVDAIVFGYSNNALHVLIVKQKLVKFALSKGFENDLVFDAVSRFLK